MSDREYYAIVQTLKETGEFKVSEYIYPENIARQIARGMNKSEFFNEQGKYEFTVRRAA
jgi:hypothetical protein